DGARGVFDVRCLCAVAGGVAGGGFERQRAPADRPRLFAQRQFGSIRVPVKRRGARDGRDLGCEGGGGPCDVRGAAGGGRCPSARFSAVWAQVGGVEERRARRV